MKIPLILPSSTNDNVLLCQIEGQNINTKGESGAIGRMSVSDNVITLDLKGNLRLFTLSFYYVKFSSGDIYSGMLYPCNTVLVASSTQISKKNEDGTSSKTAVAKIKSISNEICHFRFQGKAAEVTGMEQFSSQEDSSDVEKATPSKSPRSKKRDSKAALNNISTITQRKRTKKK